MMTALTHIYHTDSTFNGASFLFYLYVLVYVAKLSEDNVTSKYTSDTPPKISHISIITIDTPRKIKYILLYIANLGIFKFP